VAAIAVVTLVVAGVCLAMVTPALAETPAAALHPQRVLIFSVPTLTWSDLDPAVAPNLTRFLDRAAIADVATRADRQPAALGAAYVTIGAGARSAGDLTTDGEGLEVGERFGAVSAGAAYRQRTADAPGSGIVDLGIARIGSANSSLLYGAVPGVLGNTLGDHGYTAQVVANADGVPPDATGAAPVYARSAVGALMREQGRLARGAVSRSLLRHDATAPYGDRLDQSAVVDAFTRNWGTKSVALVEASDLVRADRAAASATSAGASRLRQQALRWSDQLFGALMDHVDLSRDVVLVLAPVPPTGNRSLTVAGLQGPGIDAGLLRTATTRRDGFVTLADVAPTVLDQLGIAAPESMEGRPMLVEAGHGSASDRIASLERASADGELRDDLVNPVTATVLWTAIALAVVSALLLVAVPSILRRRRWLAAVVQWVALALVGFIVATLPATLFHFGEHGGKAGYWTFVLAFAVVFAVACRLLARRRPLDALLWALGALLAINVVDQLTGGRLEFDSVFGYSATVGIRFSGIGNQSSALLATSAVLVAAFVAWRFAPPWAVRVAIAILVVSFVAITPPLFGQDFGGTLATAPAFALLGWLLLGRRVTVKAVLALIGILLASGLVVGFLDLLRPHDQRSHVGRFFEKVGNEGFSGFSSVIERKSGENAATFSSTIYIVLIVVVVVVGLVLWLRPPRPLVRAVDRVPTLRPAAVSLGVLILLSYGLNDSGLAIPAIMLALVAAAASYLLFDAVDDRGPDQPATDDPSDGSSESSFVLASKS
jgi:drug/metabolite transporter (DMT)-like permease